MSQLSDVINKAVQDAYEAASEFDATELAPKIWAKLDDECRAVCGVPEIVRLLKEASKKYTKRALKALSSAQAELPFKHLPGSVALDIDGNKIKAFVALSQMEFARSHEMRRKQLRDDKRVLDDYDAFEMAARPHWSHHPDWSAGQVLQAIMNAKRAA